MVPGHDGPGGGQADAVAAAAAGAGGIRPVKPVKQAGKLGGVQPGAGVGDRQHGPAAPAGEICFGGTKGPQLGWG